MPVYVVRAGSTHYKVGVASNVENRIRTLQTPNPKLIELVASRLVVNAYEVEAQLHSFVKQAKTNGGSEWFKLDPQQVIELVVLLNRYPTVDVSDKVTLNKVLELQKLTTKAIEKKLDYVINTYQSIPKLVPADEPKEPAEQKKSKEELFEDDLKTAEKIIRQSNRPSTSYLQLSMGLGYARAARIINALEKRGVISPLKGIKREVLIK